MPVPVLSVARGRSVGRIYGAPQLGSIQRQPESQWYYRTAGISLSESSSFALRTCLGIRELKLRRTSCFSQRRPFGYRAGNGLRTATLRWDRLHDSHQNRKAASGPSIPQSKTHQKKKKSMGFVRGRKLCRSSPSGRTSALVRRLHRIAARVRDQFSDVRGSVDRVFVSAVRFARGGRFR